MTYLLFSIVSSTLISVFMRNSEKYIKNNIAMFLVNYAVCSCLAKAFMGNQRLFAGETGIGFAILIGLFSGIMYLLSFELFQYNIRKNGMVLASTFMKLGVLVPIALAIAVFQEKPSVLQLSGFITAIVAIIVINGYSLNHKKNVGSGRSLLIILLLISGFTDSLANIYNEQGKAELKNHYLFFTFAAACLFCIIMMITKKQRLTLMDAIWGILIGIPNYFASRCLLFSLERLPAIIVYPVYNVATILMISVIGILIFKEQLEIRKRWGLALIIVSLVLINL